MQRLALFATVTAVLLAALGLARAACPSPIPPSACKCFEFVGMNRPVCLDSRPRPSCTPCVNGCDANGHCNREPYVDGGLPLVALEHDECSVREDGGDRGTCDDGAYQWACDERGGWCVDTRRVHWRVEAE